MKKSRAGLVLLAAISVLNLTPARADQPHMKAALDHLRAAREELQKSEHNKGGWRLRAIGNVNQAIADVEKGMAAGR